MREGFLLIHLKEKYGWNTDVDGMIILKVHPCTGTETLYRPYGPEGGVEV
jgi:hypothetical protein